MGDEKFTFPFINQLIAMNNFVSPLKSFLDDSVFFYLDITKFCGANFFVQAQKAEFEDSFFQLG